MAEKTELINYTLRLPEDYRKRLEMEAQIRERSLNQQILRIIEMFFAEAGYSSDLISSAGQSFRIHCAAGYSTPAETAWDFALENLKTGKEEGSYVIGFDRTLVQDLKIVDKDLAAKEIGLALLHFHARKGRDIRSLSWIQPTASAEKRIISAAEADTDNVSDFLDVLGKGQWADRWLIPNEELEVIKTLLLTSRLEQSEIIKHTEDPDGMWLQIGSRKFDGANRMVFLQALSKMGQLRLVELQEKKSDLFNAYNLTARAGQLLAKMATLDS